MIQSLWRTRASQVVLAVKNLLANAGDIRDTGSIRKMPWRRKWQPTPVFLPREYPWTEVHPNTKQKV